MTAGDAKVGPVEGAAHGHVPIPDLSRAGEALARACTTWPEFDLTPFVGVYNGRPCAGFITDRYRKAVRFQGHTFEEAIAKAAAWTAANRERLEWERRNDRRRHAHVPISDPPRS